MAVFETCQLVQAADVFWIGRRDDGQIRLLVDDREGSEPLHSDSLLPELRNDRTEPRRDCSCGGLVELRDVAFDEERPRACGNHSSTVPGKADMPRPGKPETWLLGAEVERAVGDSTCELGARAQAELPVDPG
jgi:hypothetical protein